MMQEITEGMKGFCDECGKQDIIYKMGVSFGGIDSYCYDCWIKLERERKVLRYT